jgi:hypothetical protein
MHSVAPSWQGMSAVFHFIAAFRCVCSIFVLLPVSSELSACARGKAFGAALERCSSSKSGLRACGDGFDKLFTLWRQATLHFVVSTRRPFVPSPGAVGSVSSFLVPASFPNVCSFLVPWCDFLYRRRAGACRAIDGGGSRGKGWGGRCRVCSTDSRSCSRSRCIVVMDSAGVV